MLASPIMTMDRKRNRQIVQTGHVKHWVRVSVEEEEPFVEVNDRHPLHQGPSVEGGGEVLPLKIFQEWKQFVEEFRRLQAGVEKGIQRGVYIDY